MELEMRDKSLDMVKGIGLLLVVLGHTSSFLHDWIYSFHMPLFFMLAGIFHKNGKNYKEFIKKKIKTLLIPYFSFGIILLIFWFFIGRFFGESAIRKTPLIKCVIGFLYSNEIPNIASMEFAPYIWFLTCLFIIENIFYFLLKFKIDRRKFTIIGIIFIIFSELLLIFIKTPLPWNIVRAFKDIVFYGIGYFYSNNFRKKIYYRKDITVGIFLFIINVCIFFLLNGKNYFYEEIMYLIGGMFGSIATLKIFRCIKYNKILDFLGKNTLIIFAFHGRTGSIIKLILMLLNIQMLEDNLIFDFIIMTLKIILCVPIVFIFNKYFPFLIGKKR